MGEINLEDLQGVLSINHIVHTRVDAAGWGKAEQPKLEPK